MEIRFLTAAQRELDEAIEYYNSESSGLGEEFLLEVLKTVDRIKSFPNTWHPFTENTRRCLLRRFPYGIIYTVLEKEIIVIAVAHLHRKPRYWTTRIS